MQLRQRPLLSCLVVVASIFALQASALPGPTSLGARQDAATSAASSAASTASSSPSTTSQTQQTSASATSSAQSTNSPASSVTVAPTSASASQSALSSTVFSSTVASSSPSPTVSANPNDNDGTLPVQPTITPALGVAGVILIVSGAALAFVGVRSKFLFIFESSALLVALAIVVLLVYVANPPVSDAIQGAYLVAAFVPACILGGVSLVFKDLVEGLGCLLGGFCLSMWFLVLRPGGLIQSTGGRVGLIVALTLAGASLSFSRYTRTYGLIGCLSFSGATTAVLGIDCFSRAGLKEFWIYLWNLNQDIFPLGTTTYPLTRGIIVEIACIVIITLFAVMSQLKLWKIIRDKREKRNATQAQDREERERLETGLGQSLFSRNDKEYTQWSAMFDAKAPDSYFTSAYPSAFQSSHQTAFHSQRQSKDSASMKVPALSFKDYGKEVVAVEMSDLSASRSQSTAAASSNDGNPFTTASSATEQSRPSTARSLDQAAKKNRRASVQPMSYVVKNDEDEGHWVPQPQQEPEVTPLPFTVPQQESVKASNADDAKSTATAGDDIEILEKPKPVRFSRSSTPNARTSQAPISPFGDRSDEHVVNITVAHHDDDRSSVVATLDGLSDDGIDDLPALSRSGTPLPFSQEEAEVEQDDAEKIAAEEVSTHRRTQSAVPPEARRQSLELGKTEAILRSDRRHSVQLGQLMPQPIHEVPEELKPRKASSSGTDSTRVGSKAASEASRSASVRSRRVSQPAALTKDALPAQQSDTVLLYRTNEWAKHTADADALHPDEIAPPSERGVSVIYNSEPSAPVDMTSLQHDAFTPQAPAPARGPSQLTTRNPYRSGSSAKHATFDTSPTVSRSNSYVDVQRTASQTSLQRAAMNRSLSVQGLHPNNPYGQHTIVESPIEDMPDQAEQAMRDYSPPPIVPQSETLMARRQTMLNARVSTMSFATADTAAQSRTTLPFIAEKDVTGNHSTVSLGRADTSSSRSSQRRKSAVNPDEMTLAQRKSVLQLQQGQPQMRRSATVASAAEMPRIQSTSSLQLPQRSASQQYAPRLSQMSAQNSDLIYNSHQPHHGNATNEATRDSRYASWRSSLAQETAAKGRDGEQAKLDLSRARMLAQGQRDTKEREERKKVTDRRKSEVDLRMRSGAMEALHREKMKQMQSQVK